MLRSTLILALGAFLSLEAVGDEMAKGLKFSTYGNDCWADGGDTNAVDAGECYALVWKKDGATFPGLPMVPPNPDDVYALGDDVWLVDYFPVAELDAATGRMRCPEQAIGIGSLPLWETQNGTWTVYLLDTRYRRADGTVGWGYDKVPKQEDVVRPITNAAPRRINAYAPVPGLVDFKIGTTLGPAWVELVGGSSDGSPVVADLKTETKRVDVTFDARGGICAEASRTHVYGDDYGELPVATREGYDFSGWFTRALEGERVTAATIAMSNVTVYAHWAAKDNTVTFDACGGTPSEASRVVKTDAKVGELPSASRQGYGLDGWFTARADGEPVTADTVVTNDVTYFARWTANKYAVGFDGRGGTGTMQAQPMTWDVEAALTSNNFARTGYAFRGWTDNKEELEKVKYNDGAAVSNLTDVAGGTNVLYAVWAANEYEVTFDADGGEGTMDPQSFRYDQAQALSENRFVRADYGFEGWATNATGPVVYEDGEVVSNLTAVADGKVALYAVWLYGVATVTFDARGGAVSERTRLVTKGDAVGELPTAERAKSRFAGWFTKPEGGEPVTAETIVTENVTVYAQWAEYDPTDPKTDWLEVSVKEVAFALNEDVDPDEDYFTVDSGSVLKTVKVSGLPSGVTFKFTAAKGEKPAEFKLNGTAKKKGVYYVTVAAANAGKFSQTKVMKWIVDGASSGEKDEIGEAYGIDFSALSKLVVGTPVAADALLLPSGWKISAKGLPTGLKVEKSCATDAAGVVCDAVRGTPTKPGKFAVTFTMKKLDNSKVTLTTKMDVIVDDPGAKYIVVAAEKGGAATTKSGVYVAGSTLKLAAKADKMYVFAGWCDDVGEVVLPSEGADYRATSLSLIVGQETSLRYTACFTSAAKDTAISVTTVGFDGVEEGVTDALVCRTDAAPQDFWFKVDSLSLPKISLKGLPSGVSFAGVKDIALGGGGMPGCDSGEQYYRIRVKDGSKLKPGVYTVQFNVGNVSLKQSVVKVVTIEVPNKRSGLYDGQLDYDKAAYPIVAGVGDGAKYPAFEPPASAKVSVSGLPSGLKYDAKAKVFTGVATKTGNFTVTITTTVGKTKYVDTVTLSVSALPAPLVGTFNGTVTNESVMATESFVLTATAAGKLTAKVGSLSLTKTGWDSFEDGRASVRLAKVSGKGAGVVTNALADVWVGTNGWDTIQVSGLYNATNDVVAQRNPFGKSGKTYECREAHEVAATLASLTQTKLGLYAQADGNVWTLSSDAEEVGASTTEKAALTVQVKDTGVVQLSGKLGTLSVSGSCVLTVVEGLYPYVDLVVGKGAKKVVLHLGFSAEGDSLYVRGTAWTNP